MERIKRRETADQSESEKLDGMSNILFSEKIARVLADENPEAYKLSQEFDKIKAEINEKYDRLDEIEIEMRLLKATEEQIRVSEKRELSRLRKYKALKFERDGEVMKILRDKVSAGEHVTPQEARDLINIIFPKE